MLDIDLRFENDIGELYRLFDQFQPSQILGKAKDHRGKEGSCHFTQVSLERINQSIGIFSRSTDKRILTPRSAIHHRRVSLVSTVVYCCSIWTAFVNRVYFSSIWKMRRWSMNSEGNIASIIPIWAIKISTVYWVLNILSSSSFSLALGIDSCAPGGKAKATTMFGTPTTTVTTNRILVCITATATHRFPAEPHWPRSNCREGFLSPSSWPVTETNRCVQSKATVSLSCRLIRSSTTNCLFCSSSIVNI